MLWQRGSVTEEQAHLLLGHLPADVSFADENDVLLFWSGASFKTCDARYIGRDIRDCHPAGSLPVLEEILGAFKAGTQDVATGWSTHADGGVELVKYIAVRDKGVYKGVLEVIQMIDGLQGLRGEQKLPGW